MEAKATSSPYLQKQTDLLKSGAGLASPRKITRRLVLQKACSHQTCLADARHVIFKFHFSIFVYSVASYLLASRRDDYLINRERKRLHAGRQEHQTWKLILDH